MNVKAALMVVLFTASGTPAAASKAPTFFRDGGWSGEVQAIRWGLLDTPRAWAIARHTKATAEEACSGREGPDRPRCVRKLRSEPAIHIFADCSAGLAWQASDKTRYRLTEEAKTGKFRPLEDDAAWTEQLSHRAKWTVASWLGFLCPASLMKWRLQEAG